MFRKLLLSLLVLSGVANATVLTFTASNVTIHAGDYVPPLTYKITGYAGTDTYTVAVSSGYPSCTTTYTQTSGVGSYPITCAVGTMVAAGSYSFTFVNGTVTVIADTGNGAQPLVIPIQPPGMMTNVTVSNGNCSPMIPSGLDSDAAANVTNFNCWTHTNRANNGVYGRFPKQLYFPAGVYVFNAPLVPWGSAMILLGDGPTKTIFKLVAGATGFTNGASGLDFIFYAGGFASGSNNNGYNQHFEHIGVEIGPGNPGAQGIDFIGNNADAIKDVVVWFDDLQGRCALCMNHAYPGQTLIKNFAAFGAQWCFQGTNEQEYNSVHEYVTCENQTSVGYFISGFNSAMRHFLAVNINGPAYSNTNSGAVIEEAELFGLGSGNALSNGAAGTMYARNIVCGSYANCLVDANGSVTLTGSFTEHWSGTAQTLFSAAPPTGVIISPVQETPMPNDPVDAFGVLIATPLGPNPSNWTTELAACTTSTYYVPVIYNYINNLPDMSQIALYTGQYSPTIGGTINVHVPTCVNHIMFNNYTFLNGTFMTIWNDGTGTTPLILDHITSTASIPTEIQNSTTRPMVIEDFIGLWSCGPVASLGAAGPMFFEDAELGDTVFCPNESIWGVAFDDEALGLQTGISTIAYTSSIGQLTLQASIDPKMIVGQIIYFSGLSPTTWLNGTSGIVTSINVGTGTILANWAGTHADQPPTAQTGGNYRTQYTKVKCTGCNIWMEGYKTEDGGPNIDLTNGNLEMNGGFWYVVRSASVGTSPFYLTDSNAFITGAMFHGPETYWQYWVIETKAGVQRSLLNPSYPGTGASSNMNMFYSIGGGPPPTPGPTKFYGLKYQGGSVQ